MLWAEAGARDNLAGYQRSPRPRSASPAGLPRRPSKADATPWLFCRQPAARRCELFQQAAIGPARTGRTGAVEEGRREPGRPG